MRRHYRSRLCHGSEAALLALAALVAGPLANAKPAPGPVVETPLGFVQGAVSPTVGSAVQAFLGVHEAVVEAGTGARATASAKGRPA